MIHYYSRLRISSPPLSLLILLTLLLSCFLGKVHASYLWLEGEKIINTGDTNFIYLDRGLELSGGNALFVDTHHKPPEDYYYVRFHFNVATAEAMSVWLGGSIPGSSAENKDKTSWFSPYWYIHDNHKPRLINAENTEIKGRIYRTEKYVWLKLGEESFSAGEHTIEMQVRDGRKRDGNYTMYVDTLVLIPRRWQLETDKAPSELSYQELTLLLLQEPPVGEIPLDTLLTYWRASRSDPANINWHKQLAESLEWGGKYKAAIKEYEQILALSPSDSETMIKIARLYQWHGRPREAIPYYEKALDIEPERVDWHFTLGELFNWIGRWDQAEDRFRQVLKLDPGNTQAQENLSAIERTYAPKYQLGFHYFEDSIDVYRTRYIAEAGKYLEHDTSLTAYYNRLRVADRKGKLYGHWAGALYRRNIRPDLWYSLEGWGEHYETLYDSFSYRLHGENYYSPTLSFMFEHAKLPLLETTDAIREHIYYLKNEFRAYKKVKERALFAGTAAYNFYSDDNEEQYLYGEGDYRLILDPEIIGGVGVEYRSFLRQSSPIDLYYSPEDLTTWMAKISYEDEWRDRLRSWFEYRITYDNNEVYGHNFSAFGEWKIKDNYELRLYFHYLRAAERRGVFRPYYSREGTIVFLARF